MAYDVDRDPELLRPLARRCAAVLDGLVPLPELDAAERAALAATRAGAALLAELDTLGASVRRAAREVGELGAALAIAASTAEHGDVLAADALRRAERP